MARLQLYHTGFQIIETPDLTRGRKNADFGQGFYLSQDKEFSRRWARTRKGQTTYLNAYELETEGLSIRRFSRDADWFSYLYANRAGQADALPEFDLIVGPIANDTIYDTWGIITSGLLDRDKALSLLMLGPVYLQTVVKTQKAALSLRFLGAEALSQAEIAAWRETVRQEEQDFQAQFLELLASFPEFAE